MTKLTHTIDFGDGVISKGVKNTIEEVETWKFPDDYFNGKSVLDIGAWDGFYSFYAEQQGAKSITALDGYVWKNLTWGGKTGFDIAKGILQSKVQDVTMDIM